MRVLFDQATPVPIRSCLVSTAAHEGWDRLHGSGLKCGPHVLLVVAAVNASRVDAYIEVGIPEGK
jgi:hypothetical protein